jgi:homoserine kinase
LKKKLISVEVFAPASVANLGSGFDIFGMAIAGPGDVIRIEHNAGKGLRIRSISGDNGQLSKHPEENTAGVALMAFLNAIGVPQNFDLWIKKKMPLGSGMGSSAASAVAAVFAANTLLGSPMQKKELVRWAMEGERVASGAAHADNIAPSMLGGFTLIRSMDPFEVLQLPVPSGLHIVLVHPHIQVRTSDARAVLPKKVTMKSAIAQWANTAGLVSGLYENDIALLGRSMEDFIVEPARKSLIPCFDQVKNEAMKNGAAGCSISGAGPSMVALCKSISIAKSVGSSMQGVFSKNKIKNDLHLTRVDVKGARVLHKK